MEAERVVDGELITEDKDENSLRPRKLDEYIKQK